MSNALLAARVVICTLAGGLIIVSGVLSIMLLGFSAMCTDSGTTDQCPEAVAMALTPAAGAAPFALLGIVAAFVTRKTAVIWTAGLLLLIAGIVTPAVLLYT